MDKLTMAIVTIVVIFGGMLFLAFVLRRKLNRQKAAARASREAYLAKIDAETAEEHRKIREENDREFEEWEAELLADLTRRQRERQRSMPHNARDNRRRMPSHRMPWPVVAGMRARNQQADQEWRRRGTHGYPKKIARVGKFQLWHHPK